MVINKEQFLSLLLYLLLLIGGLFLVLLLVLLLNKTQRWPYKKVAIMSEVEKKFYKQLQLAFPQYHLFVQVQLSRIIRPPKGKNELKWLNKIWRLSVDYVLVDSEFNTVAVIELDDASHSHPHRKEADLRKEKALKAAGVHLIRIRTDQIPSNQKLLALVNR